MPARAYQFCSVCLHVRAHASVHVVSIFMFLSSPFSFSLPPTNV